MNGIPWILIAILITLVLLGIIAVIFIRRRKGPARVDYRSYFIMGIFWIPTGLVLLVLPRLLYGEDLFFLGFFFMLMGIPYTIIGLVNRDKWGKQVEISATARRNMMILIGILLVLATLGIFVFELFAT